jgi:peptidoglycan/LPS O-acetylase OafA/YrhL
MEVNLDSACGLTTASRSYPPQAVSGTKRSVRYDFIDSLRGLASLSVLYLHSANLLLQGNIVTNGFELFVMTIMTKFIDIGKVGVVVFFAISGFVIPSALLTKNYTVIEFGINRFFRLYPAYWLSIVLAVYVLYYLGGQHLSRNVIAINLTMLQQFFNQPNIMELYWTLQVELIFYVICIIAFKVGYLGNNRNLFSLSFVLLGLALLLALARFMTHIKAPVALPLGLSIMFWGSLLRSSQIEGHKGAGALSRWMLGIYLILIPAISLLAYNFDAGFEETWYRYTASYFSAIAVFYVFTGQFRIMGRLWSWLGRISYSIYLFHPIFIALTITYLVPLYPHSPVAHLYIALIVGMTLIFCHFTYVYVEAPFMAIGRVLNQYVRSKTALCI